MILLPIPPNSLIHFFFRGWENVRFELLGVKGLNLGFFTISPARQVGAAKDVAKQVFSLIK